MNAITRPTRRCHAAGKGCAAQEQKLSSPEAVGQEENRRKTGSFTLLVSTGHEASTLRQSAVASLAGAHQCRMAANAAPRGAGADRIESATAAVVIETSCWPRRGGVPGVWYLVVRAHSSRVRQVYDLPWSGLRLELRSGWAGGGEQGLGDGGEVRRRGAGGPVGQDPPVGGQVLAGDER